MKGKEFMLDRIGRKHVEIGRANELDERDKQYWAKASIKEKMQTITYLRECFYGEEATTGRLQRFYTIFKQK